MNSEVPGLVSRPRLVDRLRRVPEVPLTLVSGPAGAGKTTLLGQWAARWSGEHDEPIGWIDVEEDGQQLWPPVLRALDELGLELPGPVAELLPGAPGPTGATGASTAPAYGRLLGRARLRALSAALAGWGRDPVLVLDGLELRAADQAAELAHLLDHTWGRLHLVIASRVDPVLPLYRYRLAGRVLEVRAGDLAFTDTEADELLRLDRVPLPPESVHELNTRLGGWAAGLRFAARALADHAPAEPHPADQHPSDPHPSGRRPSGQDPSGQDPSDRHPAASVAAVAAVVAQDADIAGFLLGEVLSRQDEATRRLLLRTCVPDTIMPGLAEELAGPTATRGLVELTRANMFLEPVPDQPGCYRYPPFFRDLLRAQLAWEDPAGAEALHRQAAGWLRGHGLAARSLEQLATGGLWADLATQLLTDHGVAALLLGTDAHVTELARRIPFRVSDPAASVVRATLALGASDAATCAAELDSARGALRSQAHRSGDPVQAAVLLVDALRACSVEDAATARAAVQHAARAVAAGAGIPAGPGSEGLVALARAAVALRCGDLDDARATLGEAQAVADLPTRLQVAVLGYEALADALDGRLTRARERATRALALADATRVPADRRPAAPAVALALVALERDDQAAARGHLATARCCLSLANDPISRTITSGILGHLDAAAGAVRPAADRLGVVGERTGSTDPWLTDWLRLQAAELWVAQGHADLALRELDAITHADHLGRAVVAAVAYAEQGRRAAVERSLAEARTTSRPLPVEVTRLLVEGVHESRQRSPQQALTLVERALRLAAEEEVRRPFREAAPTVRRLLAGHPQLLSRHRWLSAVPTGADDPRPAPQRAAAPAAGPRRTPASRPRPGAGAAAAHPDHPAGAPAGDLAGDPAGDPAGDLVVEPLTARETEVLGHLEELLTTEEIAARMFVSVNTVRTHVRSILRKLGVNRRNSAVRRARELGLLDHRQRPAG